MIKAVVFLDIFHSRYIAAILNDEDHSLIARLIRTDSTGIIVRQIATDRAVGQLALGS